MKMIREFLLSALVGGLMVVLPVYLAVLLVLKAMQSVLGLVKPIAALLPEWLPSENLLALVLVLLVCFLVGVAVRFPLGRAAGKRLEQSFFQKIPGYTLFRTLSQRVAGENRENQWKPALVEIEEALVPAFIVEELPDGRFTVFVPSVPTPLAGAVYILDSRRVHALEVPFTQAISAISHWGSGSKELVAAMTSDPPGADNTQLVAKKTEPFSKPPHNP